MDQLRRKNGAEKKGADMKTISKTFLATALGLCGFIMVASTKENEEQYSSNDLPIRMAESPETPGY